MQLGKCSKTISETNKQTHTHKLNSRTCSVSKLGQNMHLSSIFGCKTPPTVGLLRPCDDVAATTSMQANSPASPCWHAWLPLQTRSQECGQQLSRFGISGWNNSVPTGWILIKFNICGLFGNLSRKFKFHSLLTSRIWRAPNNTSK